MGDLNRGINIHGPNLSDYVRIAIRSVRLKFSRVWQVLGVWVN